MKTRIVLSACLLCLAAAAAFGLEVTQGNVKLVLYETSGRFNVFFAKPGGTPFSFFVREDPRTTMLQVLVDNNIYTMGEDAGFKPMAEKTATGARFVWRSPLIRVTEEFIFLTPQDAPLAEGVKVVITVENVSEQDRLVGVRCLFDTWLGEKSGTHFITSANAMVPKEAAYNAKAGNPYWISPFIEGASGEGLLSLTDAQYATQPEAVVFANWKRLYDANWDYRSMPNLDFNYFPYSFNDSAACHYYPTQSLKKKAKREIVLVLGNSASYNASKTTLVAENKTADDGADDKNKLLDTGEPPDDKAATVAKADTTPPPMRFTGAITKPLTKVSYDFVYSEMTRLDKFITDVNGKIQAGQPLTDDEIKKLRATLIDIESKAMQKE